jgi:hypothetical protein
LLDIRHSSFSSGFFVVREVCEADFLRIHHAYLVETIFVEEVQFLTGRSLFYKFITKFVVEGYA